jgi:hypothetical protein
VRLAPVNDWEYPIALRVVRSAKVLMYCEICILVPLSTYKPYNLFV